MEKTMINIRPYELNDHDFICSSYLNSTYYNSLDRSVRLINKFDHDKAMDRKINSMLTESMVLMATPEDDSDLIVGYMIFNQECLHYLYVKKDFRSMGISLLLLKSVDIDNHSQLIITHLSKYSHFITSKLNPNYTYNPFKST
jgi:hypothetical protein